jgi:hypothetical protein
VADAFYDNFRNTMFGAGVHGQLDMDAAGTDIRIIGRDEGADALNLADQDLADVLAGARIFVTAAVGSKTVGTAGTGAFDHADITASAVSGASIESLDYYNHTGTEATSQLIVNIDGWTGLPVTPNGGDINLVPAAGGVFQIT